MSEERTVRPIKWLVEPADIGVVGYRPEELPYGIQEGELVKLCRENKKETGFYASLGRDQVRFTDEEQPSKQPLGYTPNGELMGGSLVIDPSEIYFDVSTNKQDPKDYHVGSSDYSKHSIQPWDIWKEYELNPWDADIVKRVLRAKPQTLSLIHI